MCVNAVDVSTVVVAAQCCRCALLRMVVVDDGCQLSICQFRDIHGKRGVRTASGEFIKGVWSLDPGDRAQISFLGRIPLPEGRGKLPRRLSLFASNEIGKFVSFCYIITDVENHR